MCRLHIYTPGQRQHRMTTPPHPLPDASALSAQQQALLSALDGLLAPLADLCLAKGLTAQVLEERLRHAMVQSALAAHSSEVANTRLTSKVSASTGLTRREVARLLGQAAQAPGHAARPSLATEVFTRWATSPALRNAAGQPMPLPRTGAAPSFEQLAQSVTQDVHPRSLLDELCRLGIARLDSASDTVHLQSNAFVPTGDWARMTAFLGDNVGDHLRAAAANVLGNGQQHLEQAIFADELSAQSLQKFRAVMAQQWQALLQDLTPQLEQLIADDAAAGRTANQRVRVGLYTWAQPMAGQAAAQDSAEAPNTPPNQGVY
jgi:Family of unknown function (DUF6502)